MQKIKSILFNDRSGFTVLSNNERKGLILKHITNISELDQAEQTNINQGLIWLESQVNNEYLNESFMLNLHKKLFGDVWRWAGHYRLSEKNIGIEAWKIPSEMHKLLGDTLFWIQNNTYENWAELCAHFHHRLVFIHPFPNGNGRFSRIFTNYLCLRNQKNEPSWHYWKEPHERRELYINSLRAADQKKYQALIEFFSSYKS